jgi:hypothetical protein
VSPHADLQWLHDEFREVLGLFYSGSTRGDRIVRTADLDQAKLYELYAKLKVLREKHGLEVK